MCVCSQPSAPRSRASMTSPTRRRERRSRLFVSLFCIQTRRPFFFSSFLPPTLICCPCVFSVLPETESNRVKELQADDTSLTYEFARKFPGYTSGNISTKGIHEVAARRFVLVAAVCFALIQLEFGASVLLQVHDAHVTPPTSFSSLFVSAGSPDCQRHPGAFSIPFESTLLILADFVVQLSNSLPNSILKPVQENADK